MFCMFFSHVFIQLLLGPKKFAMIFALDVTRVGPDHCEVGRVYTIEIYQKDPAFVHAHVLRIHIHMHKVCTSQIVPDTAHLVHLVAGQRIRCELGQISACCKTRTHSRQ